MDLGAPVPGARTKRTSPAACRAAGSSALQSKPAKAERTSSSGRRIVMAVLTRVGPPPVSCWTPCPVLVPPSFTVDPSARVSCTAV